MIKDKSERLASIDFLRGCAAFSVVVFHAIGGVSEKAPLEIPWFRYTYSILLYGDLGVPLFFVISGFCIHLQTAKYKTKNSTYNFSFVSFWKRRLFRLYPPYFVALCLSIGLLVATYLLNKQVATIDTYPSPKLGWMGADFLVHVFMLHGLHPFFNLAGGNPPFWTLACEEYLYIMYFVLLSGLRRIGIISSSIVVLVLGLLFPLFFQPFLSPESLWWGVITSSAIVLWFQWVLGAVAVESHLGLISLPGWCSNLGFILIWGGGASLSSSNYKPLSSALWGLTFFTLINFCVKKERDGNWSQDYRLVGWFTKIGVFSYSLYLVHNPIRTIVRQLFGKLTLDAQPPLYLFIAFFCVLIPCIGGWIYYHLVERHFILTSKSSTSVSAT